MKPSETMQWRDYTLSLHYFTVSGRKYHITPTQYRILDALMKKQGIEIADEELRELIPNTVPENLFAHISYLRTKFGKGIIMRTHMTGYYLKG